MPKTASRSSRTTGSTKKTKKKTTQSRRTAPADGKPFANYSEATHWLYDHIDVERARPSKVNPEHFKLDRMRAILSKMGDPQDTLTAVHIAGTNGKGSVSAMLSSALQACGCAVGTYTSPHLTDLRERIQINGSPITHPAMTRALTAVASAAAAIPKKYGEPSFFEIMTAAAFGHLAEQAVDIAIIEVGLGGRLDSTNVITPAVSAVASVALDHTHFLGETPEKIAREKGGIFKAGVPALTFKQDKPVIETLRSVAEEAETKLEVVGKDIDFSYRFEASPQLGPHCRVGLTTNRVNFEHVPVPLPGEHQALNCGLTLAIIDKLVDRGIELPEARVFEGLAKTTIPGRMELIDVKPRVLLDGAHNPAAVEALIKSIGAHVQYDSMIMIFGCAIDKDVEGLLKRVALGADKVVFTKAKANPRACDPQDLHQRFEAMSPKMCQLAPNIDQALSIAARAASRDDLIVVTGSFYLVGEAKKLLTSKLDKAAAARA
ncbi:MAG: folylpolyglutamate synthase/dihydrofolate synthase family protein [Planctomycetota bacterium]